MSFTGERAFVEPSYWNILKVGKWLTGYVIKSINIQIAEMLGQEVSQPSYKNRNNRTIELDRQTHQNYHVELRKKFGHDIEIIGEEAEKQRKRNWAKISKITVSIDALDGTDLVVKGFYNWCTASYFFQPNSHVINSFVGVPSGAVYYTRPEGAYKEFLIKDKKKTRKVSIPKENKQRSLFNASICYYGQKAGSFLTIFDKKPFLKVLKSYKRKSEAKKTVPFRIYNFGGNPMIVKLIDGNVDAVIELRGQKQYDVIPGAFIAQKAGAFWGDLEGNCIDKSYLKQHDFLRDPEKELKYIIASSEKLYRDLYKLLR